MRTGRAIPALKRFQIPLLAAALALALGGCRKAGPDFQVLADFAADGGEAHPPAIPDKAALKDLQGRIREVTRLRGPVTVRASARGSFTAPGAREVASLVFQEDPRASHAENWGRYLFVIQGEGDPRIIDLKNSGTDTIVTTIHLPDGTDALLVANSYLAQGCLGIFGRLVSLAGGRQQVELKDFQSVLINTCDGFGGEEQGEVRASKLFYRIRDGKLEFRREHYKRKCGDGAKFALTGKADEGEGDM